MDKLGTLKKCPKCGCEEISTAFVPQVTFQAIVGREPVIIREEYMKRECTNCYYTCKEAPLDAIESKGESNV